MKISNIIIHCSDSSWGCAREIRKWHTDPEPNGRGWSDIGYHFVILNGRALPDLYLASLDGSIEVGRRLDGNTYIEPNEMGIHALGYNEKSIGICLIGEKKNGESTFTMEQFYSLRELCLELCCMFHVEPNAVLGHCETDSGKAQGKTCPDFDVHTIRNYLKGRV